MKKQQKGISLLEPLIAMVVVAVGLLGVASFQSAVFRAAEDARADSVSWLCVQNNLENYRATGIRPVTTGITDQACRDFLENFPIQTVALSNTDIAFTNENFAGIGSPGFTGGLLRPFDRTLDIPFPAVRVDVNVSTYIPPGSLGFELTFDNETGRVTAVDTRATSGPGGAIDLGGGDFFVISGFVTSSNSSATLSNLNVRLIPTGSTAQAVNFGSTTVAPNLTTGNATCIDDSTIITTTAVISNSTDEVSFVISGFTTVYDGMKIVFTGVPNGSNVNNNQIYYVRESVVTSSSVSFRISATIDGPLIDIVRAGTNQYTVATGAEYNGFLTYTCVVEKNWTGRIEVMVNTTPANKVCRYFNNGLEYLTNVAQITGGRVQSPNHGLIDGNIVQFADLNTASSGTLLNFTNYTVSSAEASSFLVTGATLPTDYLNPFYIFRSVSALNTPTLGPIVKNLNNQNFTIVNSTAACPVIQRSLPSNNNQLPFLTVQHQP